MAANPMATGSYDDHLERSRQAQRGADRWLIAGMVMMGTLVLGPVGFPVFLRGLALQVRAQREGLSVRPTIVSLLGYLVLIDSAGRTLRFHGGEITRERLFELLGKLD